MHCSILLGFSLQYSHPCFGDLVFNAIVLVSIIQMLHEVFLCFVSFSKSLTLGSMDLANNWMSALKGGKIFPRCNPFTLSSTNLFRENIFVVPFHNFFPLSSSFHSVLPLSYSFHSFLPLPPFAEVPWPWGVLWVFVLYGRDRLPQNCLLGVVETFYREYCPQSSH